MFCFEAANKPKEARMWYGMLVVGIHGEGRADRNEERDAARGQHQPDVS